MGVIDIVTRAFTPLSGRRKPQPSAVPGTSIYPNAGQWGGVPLPLPSTATVMGLPAANRAVLLISNAVASMFPANQIGPDGYLTDTTPPILTRPNETYGLFDFVQMGTAMAIMRGNFLAKKVDYGDNGFPNQLVPVPAGFWLAYYDEDGYLIYNIKGETYTRDEVFHIRANALPNQPMGIGVVEQFRRSIGQALDQQNFAADTYRSGAIPAGIINLDLPEVEQAQSDYVQNQWVQNHSGTRAPAVLPNNMKFEALSWTPEAMQFLQSRQFTVGEIAHMFNMDPNDLGASLAGSSSAITYANIEQRESGRLVDTYGPWMRRWEDELSDCMPGKSKARLVPENLQRTDSKTRAEVDQLNVGTSLRSTHELRKRDGLKPLPNDYVAPPGAVAAAGQTAALKTLGGAMAGGAAVAPGAPQLGPNGEPPPGTLIPGTDLTATAVKVKE